MDNARTRNEADTRADLIDPQLKAVGWGELEQSFIRREVICPGRILSGGQRSSGVASDYVLVYKGKKLAAVEAKKESLSYSEGVRQASPSAACGARPRIMPSAYSAASPMPATAMRSTRLICSPVMNSWWMSILALRRYGR